MQEVFLHKRKEFHLLRIHRKRVFHLCVDDIYLIKLIFRVQIHDVIRNDTRAVKRRVLHGILELRIHRETLFRKILASELADDKQLIVLALREKLMRHLDDVVVVCSCQTLIRSDHDISTPLFFLRDLLLLVKIAVLHLRNVAQESGNGTLKCIEIRFRLLKLLLGAAQFGRRYHIHGACNLHGIPDTFHSLLNFLGICHALSPALKFFDRLYNLLRNRIIQHFFLVDLRHKLRVLYMDVI